VNEAFIFSLALLAGLALGSVFFGGLWWTVRRGLFSRNPAVWFFSSLLLRSVIVLGGFYFVGRGDWRRLLVCLAGFLVARFLVAHLARDTTGPRKPLREGGFL
jgi:F1F0 ATPase subunit 2